MLFNMLILAESSFGTLPLRGAEDRDFLCCSDCRLPRIQIEETRDKA